MSKSTCLASVNSQDLTLHFGQLGRRQIVEVDVLETLADLDFLAR